MLGISLARTPSETRVPMRSAHLTLAASSLLAAAVATLIATLDPFDHGAWLVAYLFLVGFLAQVLLDRGQVAVLGGRSPRPQVGLQAVLWNAGVVFVPVGVLVEMRIFVVIGGLSLLAALWLFLQTARRAHPAADGGSRRQRAGYLTLIAAMAASVLVGTGLAWDTPWF